MRSRIPAHLDHGHFTGKALYDHRRYISAAIAAVIDDQCTLAQLRIEMLNKFIQSFYPHIRNMNITDLTVCGITHFLNIVLNPLIVIKPLFSIGGNNQRFVSSGFGRRIVYGQLNLHTGFINKSFINVVQVFHGLRVNSNDVVSLLHIYP